MIKTTWSTLIFFLFATTLTIVLMACGGGGGGGGGDVLPLDTSAAAGFWSGTSTDQDNNTFSFGGIISTDGQLRFLIDEGECFGTQFKGTFSMAGNTGSGTFTGFAGGVCVFSNGGTLISGSLDFSIAGTEMTGTFSSQEYSGTFSLTYDPQADNPINFADLAGTWIVEEGDFSELIISADGSFTGTDDVYGCDLAGQISVNDPDWSIADISVTVSGCDKASSNGLYTGLGLWQQFDAGRETFAVAVSSSTSSAFGFFASLPDGDGSGGGGEPGPVNIIGTAETVFDWTTDRCESEDIPDLPARAFRDNNGKVQLIATHFKNRRMIGDDLDSVEKNCNIILDSDHDPDPAMYNDNEWINATYTPDGETVYALIHNEYQGAAHPGQCPSGSYMNCWYNSITLAVSNDSGATYTHVAAPGHLVASVPYQYVPDAGPYGVFEGSNILYNANDGYFYKMLHLEEYDLQEMGACVMRTQNLADPKSWRAWDGNAFSVQFINPYTEIGFDPADHVCERVSFGNIDKMADNITFNTFFNKFMLVGTSNKWDPARQEDVFGFYYSLSDDLINWSERQLLMECELWWTNDNSVDRLGYPVLIDPADTSRNFSNTGQRPYLYYTRWHRNTGLDRDLERIQVEFTK